MDAHTIDILAALNPDSEVQARIPLSAMQGNDRFEAHFLAAKDRFLSRYIRTNFGWYIALKFASRKLPFPLVLTGRDAWVHKAYMMRLDPDRCYDKHVGEAYCLANYINEVPHMGNHLKAFLLSFSKDATAEEHLKMVARVTGLPYLTVEAFEALFYNVVDRREDAMYLANEVYPDSRLVELDENYLKNSSHADLLKRVAYNHSDMDLTAYMAGLGDHTHLKKLAASEDRESELTRYLMGNGLVLAHTNLLNQRSVGFSRVVNLLAASRQSGADAEDPTLAQIVPSFTPSLRRAMEINQKEMVEQLRHDEGETLDV